MRRAGRHHLTAPLGAFLAVAILVLVAPFDVRAQTPPTPTPPAPEDALPRDCDIEFLDLSMDGENRAELTGPITILCGEERIQADRLTITDRRYVSGEGNILLVFDGNRIVGSRIEYDIEEGTGTIWDARGNALNEYIFRARTMERIGPRTIRLKKATVTTCTQPNPYWSFSVSTATITLDKYAHMWNARLNTGKVPIFYTPYLVWPVKRDRAVGLLFPEFGSLRNKGDSITQSLFIPIGRSADVTVSGIYFTEAGSGAAVRANVIPNTKGNVLFDGFWIRDETEGFKDRYRATFKQTQEFENGFKLFADLNFVSDFDLLTDFERDLDIVTSPTILARLEVSRNGSWTSLNVRELRREQLFSDGSSLVQTTLPEIEWRGRSRQLGSTPLYLSFESSIARIRQDGIQQGEPIDAEYVRADVFPTLTIPLSPTPWIDIEPALEYRVTHYTQRQEEVDGALQLQDEDITRDLFSAGLNVIGPKAQRIYGDREKEGATLYKHVIEPQIRYSFQDAFDAADEIVLYDEIDRVASSGERVTYALVNRLFAKKPRRKPKAPTVRDRVLLPTSTEQTTSADPRTEDPFSKYLELEEPPDDEEDPEAEEGPPAAEPVEIATFTISQTRSFDRDLSIADVDDDGENETSSASDISLLGRYNPNRSLSLDVRGTYDVLFKDLETVTLSGGVAKKVARVNFSAVYRKGLATGTRDDTTLNVTTGFNLLDGKVAFDVNTTYDPDPVGGAAAFPSTRWSVRWQSQCCTLYFEQLRRDFADSSNDRSDFFVRVDFTGVGRILKVNY